MVGDATDRSGQLARSGGAIFTGKFDTAQTALASTVQRSAISPNALAAKAHFPVCSIVGTPFACVYAIQAWLGACAPIGARV